MAISRRRAAWISLMLAANLAGFGFLGFVWEPQWRRRVITIAMRTSRPPAFWWPPGWRRELRTSFLLEGEAKVLEGRDDGVRPAARIAVGTIELASEVQGRVFRTPLNIKGRYSFDDRLLPVGPFRVRLVAPGGSPSRWIRIPEVDPGIHHMNWRF